MLRRVFARVGLFLLIAIAIAVPPSFAAARPAPSAEARTARYLESIRNDPNQLVAFLLEMPKGGDLHVHLSGAIYAESLVDWAVAANECVDSSTYTLSPQPCHPTESGAASAYSNPILYRNMIDAYSMRNWQYSGQSGHDHFFDTFGKFGDVTGWSNTGKMLAETERRAASQNEIYQELMFTATGTPFNNMLNATAVKDIKLPSLPENPGPTDIKALWDAMESLNAAMHANGLQSAIQDAIQQTDVSEESRLEILQCGGAHPSPPCPVLQRYLFQVGRGNAREKVFAQILLGFELAKADRRFVGFNLVMPEDYYVPIHDFRAQMQMIKYLKAQYRDVPLSLHAGELVEGIVPPEDLRYHIRESVEVAGASRIGHGVDILNETQPYALLEKMAKDNVMVEICLTSNDVILGVKGKDHPLHDYMKAGVPVALATDDEGVSRSDMTHEYLRGVTDQNLSYVDLKRMARTSIEHAFISGNSLWKDGKKFIPVPECADIVAAPSSKPSAACQKLLDSSEKAMLQRKLEQQFREFEGRKWPATVESSRATAR